MAKVCGVVAEYNPFHQGHAYQLIEARKLSQAQVMVVAMSGNFVQRGEPALVDKWIRAEKALEHGADLILEIPTLGSVQAADYFAETAVGILALAGCDSLSFGTEKVDRMSLEKAYEIWQELDETGDFHQESVKGLSYPSQLAKWLAEKEVSNEVKEIFRQPNQQLSFSYIKAIKKQGLNMDLFPVFRLGSHHNDWQLTSNFASGSAIRREILRGTRQEVFPHLFMDGEAFSRWKLHDWEQYWSLLRYRILSSSLEELREVYQMNEGIENRMQASALGCSSFQEFMERMKNKRWTWTRLQRLSMYTLLNVHHNDMMSFWKATHERPVQVLGFNEVGQRYLKQLHERKSGRFETNYAQNQWLQQHQYGYDNLYNLVDSSTLNQNIMRSPIRVLKDS